MTVWTFHRFLLHKQSNSMTHSIHQQNTSISDITKGLGFAKRVSVALDDVHISSPNPTKPPRKGAAVKIKIVGDALEKFLNRIHVLGP